MIRNGARPVVYGEVLFDRFEDGSAILGGAPFNVAWHLQGFGVQPLFISRVGDDPAGTRVLETMADWGMDLSGVQRDSQRPTGAVEVSLRAGQPSYSILPRQAYDFIEAEPARRALAATEPALLYHGTLAARSETSRASLFSCIEAAAAPVFVDLNLRAPWWEAALLEQTLEGARWVKLNHEELAQLEGHPDLSEQAMLAHGEQLCRDRDLELLIVTRGEQGAAFVSVDAVYSDTPAPVDHLVDTVGAGDAFASVCIFGLIEQWPPALTLRRALDFAACICGIRGATVADRALYHAQIESWKHG